MTREELGNGDISVCEEVQAVIARQLQSITVRGRTGPRSFVINNHKAHSDVNPAKHRKMHIQFIKHVTDNRWGMTVDTLMCTTTLLVVNFHI